MGDGNQRSGRHPPGYGKRGCPLPLRPKGEIVFSTKTVSPFGHLFAFFLAPSRPDKAHIKANVKAHIKAHIKAKPMSLVADTLHWLVAASYPLCLGYAMVSDVRRLIIPNATCIVIAVMFLPASVLAGMEFSAIAWHYAVGVGLLVAGIGLFAGGLIGGGDVKLLAAVGIWNGPEHLAPFLVLMALIGGVLAAAILLARKSEKGLALLNAVGWLKDGDAKTQPLPYGVAIGLAAVYLYASNPALPEVWAMVLGRGA